MSRLYALVLGLFCSCLTFAGTPLVVDATDGGEVAGHVYGNPASDKAILMIPGARFEAASLASEAEWFAAQGFLVLAISLRGRGESRAGTAGAEGFEHDVLGAVDYLRSQSANKVIVVGASLGGWAAAQADITRPGVIDSLVLLAAPAVDAPERLSARVLYILARDDVSGTGPRLPVIERQVQRTSSPNRLMIVDGAAHAQALFHTEAREPILQAMLEFAKGGGVEGAAGQALEP